MPFAHTSAPWQSVLLAQAFGWHVLFMHCRLPGHALSGAHDGDGLHTPSMQTVPAPLHTTPPPQAGKQKPTRSSLEGQHA